MPPFTASPRDGNNISHPFPRQGRVALGTATLYFLDRFAGGRSFLSVGRIEPRRANISDSRPRKLREGRAPSSVLVSATSKAWAMLLQAIDHVEIGQHAES